MLEKKTSLRGNNGSPGFTGHRHGADARAKMSAAHAEAWRLFREAREKRKAAVAAKRDGKAKTEVAMK
jgi:hypothetical protein